jgi:protein-L-isoaspartate(D-aspartate) O-methyltransferase
MPVPYEASSERERMVAHQLVPRGILDPRVIAAVRSVPREDFVSPDQREVAYSDRALVLECGQSMPPPHVIATMVELLQLHGHERVLEVGTGSGYAAAVLARLAREVWSIEWFEPLARSAAVRLRHDGCHNVAVRCGDGVHGWGDAAPFEAIFVAAGARAVPQPLLQQLAPGGRLVMPIGPVGGQQLVRVTRHSGWQCSMERLHAAEFQPLLGDVGVSQSIAEAW